MKPTPANEVRDMYDVTAEYYAELMDEEIELPIYAESIRRLQKSIAGLSGTLIDTACGTGHMLSLFHDQYDSQRTLLGIDLSPRMVAIARERLGSSAQFTVGDMRNLGDVASGSAAAVINWYALHHLGSDGVCQAMRDWYRVLTPGGILILAAWEGSGAIDYGDESDIVALLYTADELSVIAEGAGFNVFRCVVAPVEGFPMDAVYLDCTKDLNLA